MIMKKLVVLLSAIVMASFCTSCNSVESKNAFGYDRSRVEAVIADHDTTILYFMTSWCQAGQSDFERNLKPYLGKASDTKAIVVVCVGELEQVANLGNGDKNLLVCSTPSRNPLSDKLFINKECKKMLNGYKRVNYVPVSLVCNRNGEILNWNTNTESSLVYGNLYQYLTGWK